MHLKVDLAEILFFMNNYLPNYLISKSKKASIRFICLSLHVLQGFIVSQGYHYKAGFKETSISTFGLAVLRLVLFIFNYRGLLVI